MRFIPRQLGALLCLLLVTPVIAASVSEQEYESILRAKTDATRGESLFTTCARCHGEDGGGARDGSVPAIAGQHFRVIARQLVDYRHDQRWDPRMEHFADVPYLTFAQDVADVAAYISNLEPKGLRVVGDGDAVDRGAGVYASRCASCHGAKGEGNNARAYPRLAGQHYPYLLRQMHDAIEGRRPNFSNAHVRLLSRLDRDELVGMSDYLSRLSP